MDNEDLTLEIIERRRQQRTKCNTGTDIEPEPEFGDEPEPVLDRVERNNDAYIFLKGMVVGFGLAAVASAALNLFRVQAKQRREEKSTGSRIARYDESGNILGDLSNIIDESTGAFKDAVKALDTTFESGRKALDTFNDVVDKMREQ